MAALAVPLAGLALFGVARAESNPKTAIERAAAAPFTDEIGRHAHALCEDLTPAAEATIVPSAPPGSSCETAVQDIFASTAPTGIPTNVIVYVRAEARQLTVNGIQASGIFALTSEAISGSTVKLGSAGLHRLHLEQVAGRWLVSSQARLLSVPDCSLNPPGRCHPGVQRLLFVVGEILPEEAINTIPIPPAVHHAGGRVLREFETGATVATQSGCLACHKIGKLGNRGPGPNLTHIGDRLAPHQIEHALISPREPMPSFKHLPRQKLRALVRFLATPVALPPALAPFVPRG